MALQNVPWAVGNGALNPVEGARMANFTNPDARGVAGPGDMKVTAYPTPGTGVRIARGSAKSPNDYLRSQGYGAQAYTMREQSYTDFPIPATTSSGGATRYLVVRVSDPQYAGQTPGDVANGPYNSYEWLTSDPEKNPPSYPWVLLAQVNQPASTATITSAMIVDRRSLHSPLRDYDLFTRPRVSSDSSYQNLLKARDAAGGEFFPGGAGSANETVFHIPTWANRMILTANWMGVRYEGAKRGWGSYWIEYGTEYKDHGWNNKQQYEFATQKFAWDQAENSGTYRTEWQLMDHVHVPAKLRGQDVTFVFKGANADSTNAQTKVASMDAMSGLGLRADYAQAPDVTWEDPI